MLRNFGTRCKLWRAPIRPLPEVRSGSRAAHCMATRGARLATKPSPGMNLRARPGSFPHDRQGSEALPPLSNTIAARPRALAIMVHSQECPSPVLTPSESEGLKTRGLHIQSMHISLLHCCKRRRVLVADCASNIYIKVLR